MTVTNPSPLKVLFISRAYPPTIGGMETFSFELIRHCSLLENIKATAIVNRQGKKALLFFLPAVLTKTIFSASKYDVIHLADAVLAPIGDILKMIRPKTKVVLTMHGLDLTYAEKNRFYKQVNIEAIKALNGLVAVSEATKRQAVSMGIPSEKIIVIPNGINAQVTKSEKDSPSMDNLFLERKLTPPTAGQIPIISLGRLQKRKGVVWFIKKVFPFLDQRAIYLVAGGGPEEVAIKEAIQESSEKKRIFFLGPVSESEKKIIFNNGLLFVQPNLTVAGDMEGFGITMLEASSCGLVVIASAVDGIPEAIQNKKNGFLLEEKNAVAYRESINRLLKDPQKTKALGKEFQAYTENHFGWGEIAERYGNLFSKISKA
jgi:phosphatidylinositol alpha-1,6-mannosyltransferase